jgi:large subunit ribosomal protein L22
MSAASRSAPEGGWDSLKVDELKEELEARDLPKSGRKDELVARLEEDDAAGGAPPEAPAEPAAEPTEPRAEAAEEEVSEEEVSEEEGEDVPEPEVGAPRRRRGSVETTTQRRGAAPRLPDGGVVVSARAKYVRSAPRKARLVMNHIRGKDVEQAQAILRHAPRAVSSDILKLLNSAVANAESAYELGPDELRVRRAFVDEGPTIKRYRPRALGRATRINKRTSHMTIELTTEGNGR